MIYKVQTIPHFEKEAKRLKKKFKSLNEELLSLIDELELNPFTGIPLKNGYYKIRLSIKSKGKGKSGGARVITFVKIISETVFLVSIYDKSEQSDISNDELEKLFYQID
jgi:mRNA-degrading endonuclease RelE of RelBE toxin-antitoxin system